MTSIQPVPIVGQDPGRLAQAFYQLHSLVQWLARMERSFGPQADGASVRLVWSQARRAIETGSLGDGLTVELRLPDLVLQFCEDGAAVSHPFEAEDHSPAHVEAWLLVEMLHRGVARERFSKALPYDVAHLMSGDSAEFSPGLYGPELHILTDWFSEAAALLREGARAARPVDRVPIMVRPEDLSLEVELPEACTFGFNPNRGSSVAPIFYVRRPQQAGLSADATLTVSGSAMQADSARILAFLRSSND